MLVLHAISLHVRTYRFHPRLYHLRPHDHFTHHVLHGRHFKNKEYQILAVATHSETGEKMVVYQALYGERGLWVRPAAMWNEHVERDGYSGPRFTYIGQ